MNIALLLRNLSALQKGMILILVPLLLEFAALGILAKALADSDEQLIAIEQSRQAVLKFEHFENVLEMTLCAAVSEEQGPKAQLQALQQLEQIAHSGNLGGLSAERNPELKAPLQSLNVLLSRAQHIGDVGRQILEQKTPNADLFNFAPRLEIVRTLSDLRRFCRQVVQTETQVKVAEPERLRKIRLQILVSLGAVALLSISGSLLLAWFFTSDIAERLRRITVNAGILESGDRLPLPEPGKDEIAELEQILYYSAATLRELRRKESAILDNAADIICSLDENLRFVDLSKAVGTVWSRTKQELLTQPLPQFLEEADRESTIAAFKQLTNGGESGIIENRVRCGSGFVKDSQWNVKWSKSSGKFFCVVHDVTELRGIERLKHQFLQIVCHDLRSPLMAISIGMDIFTNQKSNELGQDSGSELVSVNSNLLYLTNLVTEFLELEQLKSGKSPMQMLMVSAGDLCEVARESVQALADQKQIEFEQLPGEGLVLGDSKTLIQALNKLVVNAVSVSPPGTVVRMSVIKQEQSVRIEVEDQGPAVPKADQEFVFEKFTLPSRRQITTGAKDADVAWD